MASGTVYTSGMAYNSNPPETGRIAIDAGDPKPICASVKDIRGRFATRMFVVNQQRGGINIDSVSRRVTTTGSNLFIEYNDGGVEIKTINSGSYGYDYLNYAQPFDIAYNSNGTLSVLRGAPLAANSGRIVIGRFMHDPDLLPRITGISVLWDDIYIDGKYIGGSGGGEEVTKSVSIAKQNGTITSGSTVGIATFEITTENIADGKTGTAQWYSDSLGTIPANEPSGLYVAFDKTFNNTSRVIINAFTDIQAGEYYFRANIDGAQSGVAVLTVLQNAGVKTITVGAQQNSVTSGTGGYVSYSGTSTNIADGTYTASIQNIPSRVTFASGQIVVSGNLFNFQLNVGSLASAGITSNLRLILDGVATSNYFSLTISSASKTVAVGTQIGNLTAGIAGSVQYTVASSNIADGTYPASVSNLPSGVSASGSVSISGGIGALVLSGSASTVAGETSNLVLTIDGTSSSLFSLIISDTPPSGNLFNPENNIAGMAINTITGDLSSAITARSSSGVMSANQGRTYTITYLGSWYIDEVAFRFLGPSGNQIPLSNPQNPSYPYRVQVNPGPPGFSIDLLAPSNASGLQITFNNNIDFSQLTVIQK